MPRYDIQAVKSAAEGRWDTIFSTLAPKLAQAQKVPGRHVACPVHGGTDGFRLFKLYAKKGDGICNTCGGKSDGFAMLQWVNDWTFSQALSAVAQLLGIAPQSGAQPVRTAPSKGSPNPAGSAQGQPAQQVQPKVFVGNILFAGMKPYQNTSSEVFTVVLMTANGSKVTCFGKELEYALKSVAASRGDRVRLTKVRTEERRNSRGAYRMNIWDCELLDAARKRAPIPRNQVTLAAPPEPIKKPASHEDPIEAEHRHDSIETLWSIALPILKDRDSASPALKYFASRGLKDARWDDESLRFVPNAIYRVEKDKAPERWPALTAAVRKVDGTLVTLHRTFLTEEGTKAPVEVVKKLMALPAGETISGASIQLGKPLDTLCLAEGIETALSVQYATGIPCWCTVSANGLKTVEIPKRVRTVLIFADKDKSETGAVAAESLRKRLTDEGKFAVIINIPESIPSGAKGLDWNDILTMKGPSAFPVRTPQGGC